MHDQMHIYFSENLICVRGHLLLDITLRLVLEEAVGVVEHLLHSVEQQQVYAQLQLQLLTVVLHRQHAGQRDAQGRADLLGLNGSGRERRQKTQLVI